MVRQLLVLLFYDYCLYSKVGIHDAIKFDIQVSQLISFPIIKFLISSLQSTTTGSQDATLTHGHHRDSEEDASRKP